MLAPLMLGAVIHTFFPANRELSGAFTGVLFAGALPVLAPVLAAWLARRQIGEHALWTQVPTDHEHPSPPRRWPGDHDSRCRRH